MGGLESMKDIKDITQKKGVDVLADLKSQADLKLLETEAKKMNIAQTRSLLKSFVEKDFKDPIKVEIGAHLLRGGKIDGFKNFLPLFPNVRENDFMIAAAQKILESVEHIQPGNYDSYKDQLRKNGLWDEKSDLMKGLQIWLGFTGKSVDGKPGMMTIKRLKEKLAPATNINIEDNYKNDGALIKDYILNQAKDQDLDLCSGFVMNALEDVLVKQGKKLKQTSVDAWDLYNSLDNRYFNKERLGDLDVATTQSKILSQPKGTLLTVRFELTKNRTDSPGVSHVMMSMGDGTYIDYIHKQSRTIDMKKVGFSQKEFNLPDGKGGFVKEKKNYCTIQGRNYIFTSDASILSPNLAKMNDAENKTITYKNMTPMAFSQKIAKENTLPWEFVYTQMMKQNAFTTNDLNAVKSELSMNIPFNKIHDFTYAISDPEVVKSDIAQKFLKTLKDKKGELMGLCNLDNTEYDNIAKIAFGILGNETEYGESIKYLGKKYGGDVYQDVGQKIRKAKTRIEKGNIGKAVDVLFSQEDTEYNSKGLTQIKYDAIMDTNPILAKLYNKYNITEASLDEPEKSAIATFLFLADSFERLKTYKKGQSNYNKMIAAYNNKSSTNQPLPIDDSNIFSYLPYTFNKPSEIIRGTATPDSSKYIAKLTTNMNRINVT